MIVLLTAASTPTEVIPRFYSWGEALLDSIGRTETATVLVNLIGAILAILVPYLLGSINLTALLSKYTWKGEICMGADEVWSTYGMGKALLALLLEILQASLALVLGLGFWGFNGRAIAGFFVLFGHVLPIFYRFKGGKGTVFLATVSFFLNPIVFLILMVIFLIGAIGTRMLAFGSLLAALLYPLILRAFYGIPDLSIAMAVTSALILMFSYRESIKRITAAKEPKFELSELFLWRRF